MKLANKTFSRLKSLIKQDKEQVSPQFLSLVRSDVFTLFSSYLVLDLDDVALSYFVGDDGKYHFDIKATALSIKNTNYIS